MSCSVLFSSLRELQQYIRGGDNFCLLVDITLLDAEATETEVTGSTAHPLQPRAEVYAPYLCRYRLFSRQQASQCFRDEDYHRLMFHGDSMMRAIYGELDNE